MGHLETPLLDPFEHNENPAYSDGTCRRIDESSFVTIGKKCQWQPMMHVSAIDSASYIPS